MKVSVLWVLAGLIGGTCPADEGMWLFNRPPVEEVADRYGFRMTPEWLDHLREASVRFSTGGSGSFVSAEGLILTNHHVGSGIIASLSTPERDHLQDGFLARSREDELPCGDLELNVLESIRDVTEEVKGAVAGGMTAAESLAARRVAITELERTDLGDERRRRDVVSLYQGAEYHLYEYRRYTDVRLVFAPERQVAAFGGDPDNFEYPRFCLDACFFRAYEDGKPAVVKHFLSWKEEGAEEGELVFVSGHPGSTQRDLTHAQVLAMRDRGLPYYLEKVNRAEVALAAWSARGLENARRAEGVLFGTRNGRKARQAALEGLMNPSFIGKHAAAEEAFRKRLRESDAMRDADEAFEEIEALTEDHAMAHREALLAWGDGFRGALFRHARKLVRAADEAEKPDGKRLPGFRESNRVSFELELFSEDPVYKDLEVLLLGDSLSFLSSKLGVGDPTVADVLGGLSPRQRARQLVEGSRLDDVELRRVLYEGGKDAVAASDDPMIALARSIDGESRRLRQAAEERDEGVSDGHSRIARARFALNGGSGYPDATFSLRLSFGEVKGIEGIPFETDYAGLFERADLQKETPPFDLPVGWREKREKVDGEVPLNFISTNDITGGNSGSPVVNRRGELVGLIFDGNLDGLVNGFGYGDERARAVSVHAGGITEALRSVYEAEVLLGELLGGG